MAAAAQVGPTEELQGCASLETIFPFLQYVDQLLCLSELRRSLLQLSNKSLALHLACGLRWSAHMRRAPDGMHYAGARDMEALQPSAASLEAMLDMHARNAASLGAQPQHMAAMQGQRAGMGMASGMNDRLSLDGGQAAVSRKRPREWQVPASPSQRQMQACLNSKTQTLYLAS